MIVRVITSRYHGSVVISNTSAQDNTETSYVSSNSVFIDTNQDRKYEDLYFNIALAHKNKNYHLSVLSISFTVIMEDGTKGHESWYK